MSLAKNSCDLTAPAHVINHVQQLLLDQADWMVVRMFDEIAIQGIERRSAVWSGSCDVDGRPEEFGLSNMRYCGH